MPLSQGEMQAPLENAWGPLILAAEAGLPMRPEEMRAMQIREATLKMLDLFVDTRWGRVHDGDPMGQAEALANYHVGRSALQAMGVMPGQRPDITEEEMISNPLAAAEWTAADWLELGDSDAIPLQQALKELGENKVVDDYSGPGVMLDFRGAPENAFKWLILGQLAQDTQRNILAVLLGRPELPPVEVGGNPTE